MLKFLQSKDDFIGHLLRHIGTSAIMDLLLRLITCIENPECHMMCLEVSRIENISNYFVLENYKYKITTYIQIVMN